MIVEKFFWLLASVALAIGLQAAPAVAEISKFFGHEITIKETDPGEKSLMIDGKSALKDGIVSLDEMLLVDGQPVIIGSNASGGNACGQSPFFIYFPANGNPRVDGPLETCSLPEIVNEGDHLELTQAPRVTAAGEKWVWSPARGIEHIATTPFTSDNEKGWPNLRERQIESLSDILANGQIAASIDTLLGADKESFRSYATGPSLSAEYDSANNFYTVNCVAHSCDSDEALVYLDYAKQKPYIAWKAYQKQIVVKPTVNEWPERAKLQLKIWARKYK